MLPSLHPAIRRSTRRARDVQPRAALLTIVLGLALACAACDSTHRVRLAPNQPPTVTLTSGPVDTLSAPQSWLVDIAWTATDPDGSVDHFEYAVDPPTLKQARFALAETTWTSTRENHVVARFHAGHPDSLGPGATASEHHVFVLRAVDNAGAVSPTLVRAFYAYTIAPDVQITRPIPSALLRAQVPVPFRIEWQGHDPDGTGNGRPAFYRTIFLNLDYDGQIYVADPDSLLREGAETDWAEWQTVSADTTSLEVTGLLPTQSVLFAVLAVDEAGATTPYLTFDRNFLQFDVGQPNVYGPLVHIWSSLVDFTYDSPGYSADPLREIAVQVGTREQPRFQWEGRAAPGRRMASSRWKLDGDPFGDGGWSVLGPAKSGTTLLSLSAGTHRLYVELRDDFGDRSLGIVRIEAVELTPTADLLVVDDTRLEVDKFAGDPSHQTPDRYTLPWPSRSELDTFLFARGGYPWRGTVEPTTGQISVPGILAGYAFDTLGTRLGLEEPAAGVPLAVLARYRHVLWLVDQKGAQIDYGANQAYSPITVLRDISEPGRSSALAAYIALGGQVWLAGGGGATASLAQFNRRTNDQASMAVLTARDGELGPGRPLYDAAHVRSALGVAVSSAQPVRSPAALGGWSGHGPNGQLSAPDYSHAPVALSFRTAASDPLPPTRSVSQASLFYRASGGVEFVLEPNEVTERLYESGSPRIESTLDTVYEATGSAIPIPSAPAMLYYHGTENVPFVFSGFDLWTWTRADCQALMDFVLSDIWKLTKSSPGVVTRAGARPAARPPGAARSGTASALDPRRMRP